MNITYYLKLALRFVSYALPLIGPFIEKQRGVLTAKRLADGLAVLIEAENLISTYTAAQADGTISQAEMERILGQMTKVVTKLREAVS